MLEDAYGYKGSKLNILTVDVEDYFHTEAMAFAVPRDYWDQMTPRVEQNTHKLFEVLERRRVRTTMFFLGWVADRFPQLVAEAVALGHEVACHSYWHRPVYRLSREEFREDTKRAKDAIESAAGQQIIGYRAPSFSIVQGMDWATDILAELEFKYDSSCNPIRHDIYNNPHAPRTPHQLRSGILEIPISTLRVFGTNFPFGGGAYLRVLPLVYMKTGLHLTARSGEPLVLYLHPWEIDPDQPRLPVHLKSRLRQYLGLSGMLARLEWLLETYSFAPTAQTCSHILSEQPAATDMVFA